MSRAFHSLEAMRVRRSSRAIVRSDDGYRFWCNVCPHGVGTDDPTGYDYPCQCCGHATGPSFLTHGRCAHCLKPQTGAA